MVSLCGILSTEDRYHGRNSYFPFQHKTEALMFILTNSLRPVVRNYFYTLWVYTNLLGDSKWCLLSYL